jgi:hypothetical protein
MPDKARPKHPLQAHLNMQPFRIHPWQEPPGPRAAARRPQLLPVTPAAPPTVCFPALHPGLKRLDLLRLVADS